MKLIVVPVLTFFFGAISQAQEFSTAAMRPITLGEAYVLALARSEELARQGEGIKQLEAAERLLNSAFRPSFGINASRYKQQNSEPATKGYLYGSYSLFSGMRDYVALKAAAARTGAAEFDLARARQELYFSVARTYLSLSAAQKEIFIRTEQLQVTGKRIKELEARVEIGRSRKSEIVAVKTLLAQDKAGYLDAEAAERLNQQALRFLTGLGQDMAPADVASGNAAGLDFYLSRALLRPDIAARRKSLEAYGYLLEVQEHYFWPSLTLAGDYYVLRHPEPRPADYWDATLALNVPLYTGGAAHAQKHGASSAKRSAELDVQLAERQALTEVRSAYEEFKYAALQTSSLEEASALASENARYQADDYKLGLVTNLDVLNALHTVQQTSLAASQAKVRESLTLLKLEIAAGIGDQK